MNLSPERTWIIGGIALLAAIAVGYEAQAFLMHAPVVDSVVTGDAASTTPTTTTAYADPAIGGWDASVTQCGYLPPATTTPAVSIPVSWHAPSPVPALDILSASTTTFFGATIDWQHSIYKTSTGYYNVGTVQSGPYAGGEVLLVLLPVVYTDDGPGYGSPTQYHFIRKDGVLTLIARNSDAVVTWPGPKVYDPQFDCSRYRLDTASAFTELLLPDSFTQNAANLTAVRGDVGIGRFSGPTDLLLSNHLAALKQLFAGPFGTAYTDIKGSDEDSLASNRERPDSFQAGPIGESKVEQGVYVAAKDGTFRVYRETFSPWYNENTHIANVTWNDGTHASDEYAPYDWGGCGSVNYASVMTTLTLSDLSAAGKTSTGDTVYTLADPNHIFLQLLYKQYLNSKTAQDNYASDKDKTTPTLTYDQFVAARQLFFWYDPFGRLIKFQTSDYRTAECGKPVIYLYPTATTSVSVQVTPTGGMTKSDPAYGNGWNVLATPQSVLTNVATGLSYPYLFWEGNSSEIYRTPAQGWVVAKDGVHDFLNEKLTALGLNMKEMADFEEFWEPRMKASPYYFITFEGNETMNRIAPLFISPAPDTVIRVLMDFKPLQKPVPVESFNIKTPERRGFTVVEWGGVLQ